MELVAHGPIVTASVPWQRANHEWVLTIVAKLTFDVVPSELQLSTRVEPIHERDRYRELDGHGPSFAPSDLVPQKNHAHVVLVGRAHLPPSPAPRPLAARLTVGKLPAVEASLARGLAIDPPLRVQLADLSPSETLVLDHLHPEHPHLVTKLAGVHVRAVAERAGHGSEVTMTPDLLWIDAERSIATVTFRGQLALTAPPSSPLHEGGRLQLSLARSGHDLSWDDAAQARHDDDEGTLAWRDPALEQMRRSLRSNESTSRPSEAIGSGRTLRPMAPPRPRREPVPPAPPARPSRPASVPPPAPKGEPTTVLTASSLGLVRRDDGETTRTSLRTGSSFESAPAALPFAPPSSRMVAAPPPPPVPPPPPAAAPAPPPRTGTLADAEPRDASPWLGGARASGGPSIGERLARPAASPAPALAAPPLAAPSSVAPVVTTPVELVWFDPEALPRIRSRFAALVDELDFEPLDPEHDLPVADPYATRDRHHAFGVLTRGELADGRSLSRAMQAAVGRGGRFTPPVVLLSGELRFPLDEAKALEIAVGLVNPIAGDDRRLREALDAAAEVLKSPLLQGQGQLERTHQHLRDAMGASKRGLSPAALDTHVERALVEQRLFHRRSLFGAVQLRALFAPLGESAALPAYLPASMAPSLPLVTRWSARLLAELYPQQDQYEPQPLGLRVVAVGRALQL